MRVLLVGPDLEENLSLRYLAASLRQTGHVPRIATFDTINDADAVLASGAEADLIALSMCYQIRAEEYLGLARAFKEARPDRPVIAGGHYASCAAAELLANHPELDIIAVHEGEHTLPELASLDRMTAEALGTVRGIVYRTNEGKVVTTVPRAIHTDLDSLPWPDRSGPARLMGGVPTAYVMGSRGCLYSCDYCCITTLHRLVQGKRFRQRSPENIAHEMAWLYHERGVRQFIFHDDNFLVPSVEANLERIEALDREMRRCGLRDVALALKCRPAEVDRQVFIKLREMGLLRIFLGIESGSAAGLASIGRRQTIEDEHRALRICEELGISTQYTIILFHPESTAETMLADLAFVRQHPGHPLSFCRAEIYAGTPLERRMVASSRATGNYLARVFRYSDPLAALIWNHAEKLLLERCFSQTSLMGQIIRLDHLAAVFKTFYDGPGVGELVRDFANWEVEVNLDTVALLEELVCTCQAYPDADSPELMRRVGELLDRERARRQVLAPQACSFREAFDDRALSMLGLSKPQTNAPPARSRAFERPRHAAAVLLAVGLLQCGGESTTSTPDAAVVDDNGRGGATHMGGSGGGGGVAGTSGRGGGGQRDGGAGAGGTVRGGGAGTGGTAGRWVNQGGMWEAPPPPLGGRIGAGGAPRDGGADAARDAQSDTGAGGSGRGGWVNQGGMWEAPPPPLGGRTGAGGGPNRDGGGTDASNADDAQADGADGKGGH